LPHLLLEVYNVNNRRFTEFFDRYFHLPLKMNFLDNCTVCTGFLLNGVYGLNLPLWPSKLCTLVSGRPPYLSDLQHHEPTRSLRLSSVHQLSVPRHNLTLDLVLSGFLLQEFGIHYLSVFTKLSHFSLSDVI